jgi:hypothetical protein
MAWPGGPSGDDRPPDPNAPGPGGDAPLAVTVPDDASELAAEVAAYRREIRSRRRRERLDRWTLARFWRPYGITGPVVIAALVVIGSVGGLLLALLPNARTSEPQAETLNIAVGNEGQQGGLLLNDQVWVDGESESAQMLRPGVIALVTPDCHCLAVIDHITAQATEFELRTYVVTPESVDPQMAALTKDSRGVRTAVYDPGGKLRATYAQHTNGVTVLIVEKDGVVRKVVRDVTENMTLRGGLTQVGQPGA